MSGSGGSNMLGGGTAPMSNAIGPQSMINAWGPTGGPPPGWGTGQGWGKSPTGISAGGATNFPGKSTPIGGNMPTSGLQYPGGGASPQGNMPTWGPQYIGGGSSPQGNMPTWGPQYIGGGGAPGTGYGNWNLNPSNFQNPNQPMGFGK